MPDISLCKNEECPRKKSCFRFMAKPKAVWQSYQGFNHRNGECEYFIDASKYPHYRMRNNSELKGVSRDS